MRTMLAAAALVVAAFPAQAQNVVPFPAICGSAKAAYPALEANTGEVPMWVGATATGGKLVVFVSPAGGFTVAIESPGDDVLCVIAIGDGFDIAPTVKRKGAPS